MELPPHEIHAKAIIAAALIADRSSFDMSQAHTAQKEPSKYQPLVNLRNAVDAIYRGLFNPR